MSNEFRLPGLETDNLLGFLALLGLLRCLEHEKPKWAPRAYFSGIPFEAKLVIDDSATGEEIAAIAATACNAYAPHFIFDPYTDLTFDGVAARQLLVNAASNKTSSGVVSALFSDAAVRPEKDNQIDPTRLCAMFGQGHQSFLTRLRTVSHGTVPRSLRGKNQPNLNESSYIERALFAPWTRSDSTESFRWDYREDRRYALRAVNPSTDTATTEHGANRLAVVGLLSFQSAPAVNARSGRVHLSTRGVSRGSAFRITWPIWTVPAGLETIHAMLDEPELSKDVPSFDILRPNGIEQARRVTRLASGKFLSFSRADPLI